MDTNVLLDIATRDPIWSAWSLGQLEVASLRGSLLINDVVYAELAVRYDDVESLDTFLKQADVVIAPISRKALFLAGKTFTQYRRSGGTKHGVLPDFFIGAHASTEQLPLLTRDTKRYLTYFPAVALIAPEPHGSAS